MQGAKGDVPQQRDEHIFFFLTGTFPRYLEVLLFFSFTFLLGEECGDL
jgi:hypothetical protein